MNHVGRACSYCACSSDTPLIYKAVPSWFVRVENLVDKLLTNNMKSYWYAQERCVKIVVGVA